MNRPRCLYSFPYLVPYWFSKSRQRALAGADSCALGQRSCKELWRPRLPSLLAPLLVAPPSLCPGSPSRSLHVVAQWNVFPPPLGAGAGSCKQEVRMPPSPVLPSAGTFSYLHLYLISLCLLLPLLPKPPSRQHDLSLGSHQPIPPSIRSPQCKQSLAHVKRFGVSCSQYRIQTLHCGVPGPLWSGACLPAQFHLSPNFFLPYSHPISPTLHLYPPAPTPILQSW